MAQSTITRNIVLNGKVGTGFNQIADKLTSLGSTVETISRKVREIEEASLGVYKDYETNMLEAQFALSAQYKDASELQKIMGTLGDAASNWAATTIFHTDDVSNAISEAAHAGWDFEQIMKGIPNAMLIAQAGGLDLSSGLDYLVKMMNATGTSFDDMGTIVDQWAKASNLSATNIGEMGEAFMALGSAATFADDTGELFTMLSIMANVGMTGSQAGTAIRSAMMRLIAPTTKAEAAMSLLGADSAELEEVLSDENVSKAAKTLEGLGFSAYDSSGNLKPMLTIFRELFELTEGLDEATRNEIIGAIFPTRTIATALAMLNSAGDEYDDLYGKITDSGGYAESGAEIMMSGLMGATETMNSKIEEAERRLGETLAPLAEDAAGWIGDIVDGLNALPEETWNGLVTGVTTLGVMGSLLLGAGGIAKFFAMLGPWGTMALFLTTGIAGLIGYLTTLEQKNFEAKFGTLDLDLTTLGEHVDSIQTKFDNEKAAITGWYSEVEAAEAKYADTSSKLSSLLMTDVLTGKKLSQDDINQIEAYASEIYKATYDGISSAQAGDMSFLQALFGDKSTAEESAAYNEMAQITDQYYGGLYQEAYDIGEELRNQMTAALQDKTLDEGERQAIQATIARLNEIHAQIAAAESSVEYNKQLYKAQSVSWDSASAYMEENTAKMEADLASVEELYAEEWARYKVEFDKAVENGTEFTDLNGQTRKVTEDDWAAIEAEIFRERDASKQAIIDQYGNLNAAALETLMSGSDYAKGWKLIKAIFGDKDSIATDWNGYLDMDSVDWGALYESGLLTQGAVDQLFGLSKNNGRIRNLLTAGQGNATMDLWSEMLDYAMSTATSGADWLSLWDMFQEYGYDPNGMFTTQAWQEKQEELNQAQAELNRLYQKQERLNGLIADNQATYDYYTNQYPKYAGKTRMGEDSRLRALQALFGIGGSAENPADGSLMNAKVNMDADVAAAEKKVADLQAEIDAMEPTVHVNVEFDNGGTGNNKGGAAWSEEEFLKGMNWDANGGRETTPSIFGEAGPEWAIPEAHTDRTAALLNAARAASGFSWSELIARNGGLNGSLGRSVVIQNYSPTIHAEDATGVEAALKRGEERLKKLVMDALAEADMRKSVEVYA